jgi:PhoH-like ATPase
LGGVCKRRYKKSTWTHNGIKITRGKSINVTLNLPPDINPFRLERKKNKVIPKTKYKPTRYIESVEEVGETECQCIMVDNDSHLYITDDFIVTHNTILTLAVGLDYIDKGIYDRIIVIKPLIPVGGKDIGALPGDKWEKLSAWLGPMRDNIEQLVQEKTNNSSKHMQASGASFEELVQEGKIEVEAMAFIQGRSIPNSLVIVDECQNLIPREARMVVERCGKGSKVVFLGDLSQVENPFLDARSCGLAHAVNGGRMQPACGTVSLSKVERSELAAIASVIFSSPESRR